MGARVIAFEHAKELIKVWLSSEFSGGNSTGKVNRINAIEAEYHSCG
jgi:ribose 5-phosphate isomerase B